jgi:hypothetical protein
MKADSMNIALLEEAVALGKASGRVFLATANAKGVPHLTIVSGIEGSPEDGISITGWLCPGTAANIEENPYVGITVWDEKNDRGYQILGEKAAVRPVTMLDGFFPAGEEKAPLPQVGSEIVVRVNKILEFKRAPHGDNEMQ